MENEERLIQLETKISYLENDLQELNGIVIEQAKLIAKLSADAEEFRRLKGEPTGAALAAAIQASPYREIDLEPKRAAMSVRDVIL